MTTESTIRGVPVGRTGRVLLGLWCLFLLGGFSVAVMLSPDPRGFGTHQRLGLPPCSIRSSLGIPCPTCGMTTSFANFVRGRFVRSIEANLGGFVLACACALQIPWSLVSVRRGCLWGMRRPDLWLLSLLAGVFTLAGAHWAVRLWW
ncbi:MAG: DUF2752 domain-containing protein [Planctomycetaceae bacterium]